MWARLINAALGIWLMAAPAVLGYGAPAETSDRIAGPLIATFAIVAIWEATRPCRWVCFVAGLWLVAAPFLLGYGLGHVATPNSIAVGAAVAALATHKGPIEERFDGGWSMLWK